MKQLEKTVMPGEERNGLINALQYFSLSVTDRSNVGYILRIGKRTERHHQSMALIDI